jgi:hypothetical protein
MPDCQSNHPAWTDARNDALLIGKNGRVMFFHEILLFFSPQNQKARKE